MVSLSVGKMLVKSKNAMRKNVAAEIKASKPPKQAVAISYSVKRAAAKKGGMSKSKSCK